MTRYKHLIVTLGVAVLLALGACNRPAEEGRPAGAQEAWQQMHRQMATDYDSMRTWYDQHMSQMPADLQQVYRQLDQMYDRWNEMQEGTVGSMMMSVHRLQEWDQQMLAVHQAMAQMHREAGQEEIARWHEGMMQSYQQVMGQLPDTVARAAPSSPEGAVGGPVLYARQCASCHGENGEGLARAFPPLAQSQWVAGDKQRLVRVLLYGLEGGIEVQGQSYNGIMPAFGARLSNEEAAAVLSYIRTAWGNGASRVSAQEVNEVREQYRGRQRPWPAAEFK